MDTLTDAPIQNFSQCHVGITSALTRLEELLPLLDPAQRARRLASDALEFFSKVVLEHHGEEEGELFPAVLRSAQKGEESVRARTLVDRLTLEHRDIESAWKRMEPGLRAVAKGQDARLDADQVQALVDTYRAHASFEEQQFLPFAQSVLGRNSNHMAALGLSLHMRHVKPSIGYL